MYARVNSLTILSFREAPPVVVWRHTTSIRAPSLMLRKTGLIQQVNSSISK